MTTSLMLSTNKLDLIGKDPRKMEVIAITDGTVNAPPVTLVLDNARYQR